MLLWVPLWSVPIDIKPWASVLTTTAATAPAACTASTLLTNMQLRRQGSVAEGKRGLKDEQAPCLRLHKGVVGRLQKPPESKHAQTADMHAATASPAHTPAALHKRDGAVEPCHVLQGTAGVQRVGCHQRALNQAHGCWARGVPAGGHAAAAVAAAAAAACCLVLLAVFSGVLIRICLLLFLAAPAAAHRSKVPLHLSVVVIKIGILLLFLFLLAR